MVVVVVVSGLPRTGKTTLARTLAKHLGLPLVAKDDLKETLFDTIGWNDLEEFHRLGVASIAILYRVLRANLRGRVSTIVESNFRSELDGPKLLDMAREHEARLIQVHCRCDGDVLLERFLRRIGSPDRHPGHGELPDLNRAYLSNGPSNILDLPGVAIVVDTTDFATVDSDDIARKIRACL